MNAPAFCPLTILDSHAETPELTHLTLGRAELPFLQAHTVAGQYVQVQAPDQKPGFFALANQPGNDSIELLLKRGASVADYAIGLKTGETLQVSTPAGKGYPMQSLRGHDVLLAGMGSGMAPLRSAVQFILRERDAYGSVRFFYGARGEAWVPYRDEIRHWAAHAISFHTAWSEFNADGTFRGERVQDLLRRERPKLSARWSVLVCGMKAMTEDITAVCGELGVPKERVFQNF